LENSRSQGTDVAVIARYCFAIAASLPQSFFQFFPTILWDHQQLGRAAVDGTWAESSVSCKAQ
jgi:hypothetical protein